MYEKKCRTLICWNEVGEQKLNIVKLIEITSEKFELSEKGLRQIEIDRRVMQILK